MLESVEEYLRRVSEYGWSVAIELLLIGLVLYAGFRFLVGTRGLRLMRGLVLILVAVFVVLQVFASVLQLERISVLARPLMFMIFFGSLVVFQPELRRALMRLGETRWLRRFMREGTRTITPIVAAVKHLSARKVGAIIAIERSAGLGAILESGIKVDAVVSSELLQTIFWPNSPLHDLGVVIHEGRIAAASCQFPLAEHGQLDPSLGSRHRAAVGLSEDSDAVVIVVSEETGAISLAVEGKLYRGLTGDALEQELKSLLNVKSED